MSIYQSPEYLEAERLIQEACRRYLTTGNQADLEAACMLPPVLLVRKTWQEQEEAEKRGQLLAKYARFRAYLEETRGFWERQAANASARQREIDAFLGRQPGETARLSWIGEALRHAQLTPEELRRAESLDDREE